MAGVRLSDPTAATGHQITCFGVEQAVDLQHKVAEHAALRLECLANAYA